VERVSTTDVFDHLEIPMERRPNLTVRLSRVLQRLGWANIRARGLNPGSYIDRVRGFYLSKKGPQPGSTKRSNDLNEQGGAIGRPVWCLGYLQATVAVNRSVYLWQS
jgi:hypothetical protein